MGKDTVTQRAVLPNGWIREWGPYLNRITKPEIGEVKTAYFDTPRRGRMAPYAVALTNPDSDGWYLVNFCWSEGGAHSSGQLNVLTFGGEYAVVKIEVVG